LVESGRYREGKFLDVLPRSEPSILKILPKWLDAPGPYRRPQVDVPFLERKRADFLREHTSDLDVTWLGHSTLLLRIEGKTILIDPVWGKHVAPLPLESMARFYPPPLPFDALPAIDLVVISHDHYDHLDYETILLLKDLDVPFFVPLGVGSHLRYWGISPERISEHDWWDETLLGSDLRVICTPARHFSGRGVTDRDRTLWASWTFVGQQRRVFYSGDTAMFPGFADIGQRYGPFDITMIETGAYNQLWVDVHLGPEQAVRAHKLLQGKVLLPVHWGLFDLGMHGWTEPIERTLAAAAKHEVTVVTPRPGETVTPLDPLPPKRWWPERPFQTAKDDPIVSTGLN
jgi:L-ascorbate metabolism protein UlaG (beta-lactamase superfamily)